jgi:hypothetical protein
MGEKPVTGAGFSLPLRRRGVVADSQDDEAGGMVADVQGGQPNHGRAANMLGGVQRERERETPPLDTPSAPCTIPPWVANPL